MDIPKKPAPVTELQANLRHMAEHWALYQADGIDAHIPLESTHPSAIEARKWTAMARAAKTQLTAAQHIQDALVHLKDFELYDGYKAKMKANTDLSSGRAKPRQKSPMRAAIIKAMGPSKRDGHTFKAFMQMWYLGDLNGLTAESIENGSKYQITDENGDLESEPYTWGTLEKMYSES